MARLVRIQVEGLGRYQIGNHFRVGWEISRDLLAVYFDEKKCALLRGTNQLDRSTTDAAIYSGAVIVEIEKPNIIVVKCNLPPLPDEVLEQKVDGPLDDDTSALTAESCFPTKEHGNMKVLTRTGVLKRVEVIRGLASSLREEANRNDDNATQADDPMMQTFWRTNAENDRRAAAEFEKEANALESRFLKE